MKITARSRVAAVLLIAIVAMGCGGASRKYLLVQTSDSGELIEAINRASVARGFDVRVREERVVKFYLDRESGTQLNFQAKRNGLLLVVRVRGGEEISVEMQEAEFARGEAIGREIMREANALHAGVHMQQQMQAQAEAQAEAERERRDAEAREREAAEHPQQNQDLADFMNQNRDRNRAFAGGGASSEPSSGSENSTSTSTTPSTSNGGSLRCCINGAYYSCPNAAAIDQCVGRFTRCIGGCGLDCMEQCLQTDPPDPSSCSRDGGRDSEC